MGTIIDTQNLAEAVDFDGDQSPREDMSATTESDPAAKIEFHVQMRSWTIRDMEDLIVQAAASQVISGLGDRKFSKLIEDRAIAAVTAQADTKIAGISAEIIDQPLTPSFGDKKPVTMREYLGLYAKDYLTQVVDSQGKPSSGGWGGHDKARIVWIVERAMDAKFKREIEAATNAAVREIQQQVREMHEAVLTAEKARIRDALAKVTS